MIDHERAVELARLSPEPGLDPADSAWLEDHLATCESCRIAIGDRGAPDAGARSNTRLALLDGQAIRRMLRRPAFLATIGAVAVALVAGVLVWNVGRPTTDGVADGDRPSASPSAAGSAVPSARPDPWASGEPLPGTNAASTAILTAVGSTGDVIPLDAGFRLASVDASPASELAARLTVQPTFDFSVKPEADDRVALLTPAEPLQAGAVYRFALKGAAGELLDSWAFQARQPLRVVGTIPSQDSSDVPTDSGIEILFDQDGVTDAASHFTMKPSTKGRFEQHGRTLVFIPDHRLTPATVYTVTVSNGVTVGGTGEATDQQTRFQFETSATSKQQKAVTLAFPDPLVESPTTEPPTFGLWWFSTANKPKLPKSTRIEVYRLTDLAGAIKTYQSLRTRPDWSLWSTAGLVDTKTLSRVASVDARLHVIDNALWARLPKRLPAGWYLLQHPDGKRPVQTVLQVTDVAGYLAVSEPRTLVWANDLKSGDPIANATVESDGVAIGRTDARGLAIGTTPKGLVRNPSEPCSAACDPVVSVRTPGGRAIFLPVRSPNDRYEAFDDYYGSYSGDQAYWSLFNTDRIRYRPTDTVNVWGVIRDRETGKVPSTVSIRLSVQNDGRDHPAVATIAARPDPSGAYTGSIGLTALPAGFYVVEVLAGADVVRASYIQVGPIAKPAYQLDITTGRRVYVAGDRIKATVHAAFYEGTPVAGVSLAIGGYMPGDDEVSHKVKTDATGAAIYRTTAKSDPGQEGSRAAEFLVNPARAEEGEISGASRGFVVFPSRRTVDANAKISSGRVRVSGSVHVVDLERLESEMAGGRPYWDLDPNGASVGGATVTVRFVELVPVRRAEGTRYDFIEKKVVQVYVDDIVQRAAGSVKVKTTSNGTFNASIPASVKDHDYSIYASVKDADGRVARSSTQAERHPWSIYDHRNATLVQTNATNADEGVFGIGDRVELMLRDPATKQAAGDGTRYLFFLAQRGLREATVQSSPQFATTYPRWATPNMDVGAVRFDGHGYVGALRFSARFDASSRGLRIDLSPAAPRYAPGDMATVDVQTRDASGAPIAATVVLRAIDEKLFAMGAAMADDPLAELYVSVQSGIVDTYGSHQPPSSRFEGGDTTGGGGEGDRNDFRDSVLFTSIETGTNGRGSVSFRVSDDLTSWRVSASAITADLEAGAATVLVPVGLPFFVDASIAPEYLRADRPSIAIRTYGTALTVGDPVTIEVTSKSLGYESGPIRSAAFETSIVSLPGLQLGTQTVTISATTGTGASARTDRLTRSFTVVDTHLTQARTTYVELPASGPFGGGEGLTTVVVSDASGGRYLPLLTDLASGGGARLDRGLAAQIASSLLVSRFKAASTGPDEDAFDAGRYQTPDGGLALLPYASSDLELSALVALVGPDRVDRIRLAAYLQGVRDNGKETRERRMFALAGLAGLREPVLPAIRTSANDASLTIREQLMIGLGAAALGDTTTARSVAASLIADHGERLGAEARLRVGETAADITPATALMAVLGAAVGDARAPEFWAYVEANPAVDQLQVLPAVAYVTNTLDRLPIRPASFAYTVDGTRRVVDLDDGQALELTLTSSQLATLTLERVTGSVGVTTTWHASVRPAALKPDPDVTIARSVSPSTAVDSADLVTVDLNVTFGPQAADGCHQVTELVPSGLTPVGLEARWIDSEDGRPALTDSNQEDVFLPYAQSGPRVLFCAEPGLQRVVHLRYIARVVTPGTYAWEPAIAESRSQEGHAALTAAGQIVIR
jgi:hypothetical protein